AGHSEEASRYGELAAKYEERTGIKPQGTHAAASGTAANAVQEFEISVPVEGAAAEQAQEAPAPMVAKAPTPSGLFFHAATTASAPPEAPVPADSEPEPAGEIDLSSEWEQDFSVETAPPSAESLPPVIE